MVTGSSCHDGQQTGKLRDKALIITWAAFPCNNLVLWCFVGVKTSEPSLWWHNDHGDQSDTWCEWTLESHHWLSALVLIGQSLVLMVTEVESSPNWRWQRAHASLLSSMESPATQWQHNNLRTIRQTSSSCLSSSQLTMRYRPMLSQFHTKKPLSAYQKLSGVRASALWETWALQTDIQFRS